jgi:hypothetical protein
MAGVIMPLCLASVEAYNWMINSIWWWGYYGLGAHAGLHYRDSGPGTPFA